MLTYSSDFPLNPYIVLIPLGKRSSPASSQKSPPKSTSRPSPSSNSSTPIPPYTPLKIHLLALEILPLPASRSGQISCSPPVTTARGAIKDPTAPANTAKTAALRLAQTPPRKPKTPTKTPQNSKNPAKFPSVPLNQAQQNALQALQEAQEPLVYSEASLVAVKPISISKW